MNRWFIAGLLLLVCPSTPAWAAPGLPADRNFWLIGFLLLFTLALGVQISCYLEHRQRRRARNLRRPRYRS